MEANRPASRVYTVRTDRIGLCSPNKDDYFARWRRYGNDPVMALLTATHMPPVAESRLEFAWDKIASGAWCVFEVWLVEEDRCIGEAMLFGISWPHGSALFGLKIIEGPDRGKGYGTEAGQLLVAYGFDGLGLHRISIEFLATNDGLRRIGEAVGGRVVGRLRENAWAFGGYQDTVVMDVLRGEMAPHPGTAHLRAIPPEHRAAPIAGPGSA